MTDERRSELLKVLQEEYGIKTMWQLEQAVRAMQHIDISQFVLRREGETANENQA